MFLDFYRLREQPFGVTPDPRYLYLGPGHREALASLFYGIETGRGFQSLIAEPGMGKTTLLNQLLLRWQHTARTAFVFQTQCDSRDLVRHLLQDLGLECEGLDVVRQQVVLNELLVQEAKAGKHVVLIIDEAQNLTDNVLETVRLLSDFEAPDKKLLQIILAGQPELARRLSRPCLAQLRQRIAIQARLDALPADQVSRYINHRLTVAGYYGHPLFSPEALALVVKQSRGIPRLIDHLCFNALSIGCATGRRVIDSHTVKEAAVDLGLEPRAKPANHPPPTSTRPAAQTLSFPQSVSSRARGGLARRRLIHASVLLGIAGGVAIHLGGLGGVGTSRLSFGTQASTALTVPTAAHPSGPVRGTSNPVATQQSTLFRSSETDSGAPTYVVQRNDTLGRLCLWIFGRYDRSVLAKLRTLNPWLTNPDHLETGQLIRLPPTDQP